MLSWLGFFGVAKLGCEGHRDNEKLVSSPGLTRWSMGLRRTLIGPNCTRPFSMDHRVKPGGDEGGYQPGGDEVRGQTRW